MPKQLPDRYRAYDGTRSLPPRYYDYGYIPTIFRKVANRKKWEIEALFPEEPHEGDADYCQCADDAGLPFVCNYDEFMRSTEPCTEAEYAELKSMLVRQRGLPLFILDKATESDHEARRQEAARLAKEIYEACCPPPKAYPNAAKAARMIREAQAWGVRVKIGPLAYVDREIPQAAALDIVNKLLPFQSVYIVETDLSDGRKGVLFNGGTF